mmetsp:Transcript_18903/g.16813  ORF Transcript_18903/g.16813 Transcript_18903/m.16813 type:complete len:263 (+) Transcript_18903:103-891(+)|eukprot:CAMPEP_0201566186 /NCGR_PEP_ID=MMETSP0190_2-20130828/5775_1 /ASSEMBLY_ACC=CAM_ASM_000263 /TAXON_ID=37353 /ORGANISM="Rosalina sp." /LENGTH=262 /DNA_ID=CAMNT_0047984541 /DNA_START=95 /DNA_END=883 /DNA_ORIENTATION=+
MANIKTVWDNKKSDVPKDHEMFTSQGGQSGTGILRPVSGPNKKAAQEDPDYLRKMMANQQEQGLKTDNKFDDAIYIYKNGYKIGNGPFKDATNNEENKKFLEELNQGIIPSALEPILKQQFGDKAAEMEVKVVNKKNEDYVEPKKEEPKFQAFKGNAHSMVDDAKKADVDASFDTVKPEKINCNDSQPNTRIQVILIGGKKETLKVNLSNTVLQIYAHVKAVSGYEGKFSLLAGFPPKPLNNPSSTVEDEKLQGSRVQQKKV